MLMLVKKVVEKIPEPIGRCLARIPFSCRLGPQYQESRTEIHRYKSMIADEQRDYIVKRMQRIVEYAFCHNEFYRAFYMDHGFTPDQLVDFEDIDKIPIVSKSLLKESEVESRSSRQFGRVLVNTGGTSGEPLHFYLDRNAVAREWGHMHHIWSSVGYRPTDLKLTFRGKNLGSVPIRYNAVGHEYLVNAYCDPCEIQDAILSRLKRSVIRYIHGYPSLIYDFAVYCDKHAPDLVNCLRNSLHGILLGSEYPAPVYRDTIEAVFGAPTVSWYGHSEAAVLAFEDNARFCYDPMMTYGYAEAIRDETGQSHLVATSYYNRASPFIRYDTGDIISPQFEGGLLSSFKVSDGRIGEFVVDRKGQRISLTALIFGRHHRIFERARFVQVAQTSVGEAKILITLPQSENLDEALLAKEFDLEGIDMDFRFRTLTIPYTAPSGKVPLLVSNLV